MRGRTDAVVVGSGPNGLAAAVTLAAAGLRVQVIEGAPASAAAAGPRSSPCPASGTTSAPPAHPLAVASPFFQRFDLAARGVQLRLAGGRVRPSAGRRPRGAW